MAPDDLGAIAQALRTARLTHTPISPPIQPYPDIDADGAFEVQRMTVALEAENVDRMVGYKLGDIAKAMQDAFGLDHPDYGFLLASTLVYEGTKVRLDSFIKLFVELEPAFVLTGALKGPNVTVADVINAVDYALPAVEIIDSRVQDRNIDLEDTLADNGSTGAIVLGGTPRRLTDLSLSNTRGCLQFNGVEIMAGNTRSILGNPIAATACLVNRLAAYDIEFQPGQTAMRAAACGRCPWKRVGIGHAPSRDGELSSLTSCSLRRREILGVH